MNEFKKGLNEWLPSQPGDGMELPIERSSKPFFGTERKPIPELRPFMERPSFWKKLAFWFKYAFRPGRYYWPW